MSEGGPTLDLGAHEQRVRATRGSLSQHLDAERGAYGSRFAAPEISVEVAEHQRHQTRVPTRSNPTGTVLSMGRRHDGHNRDGFGLTTIAHVDVSARGGKMESRMTLQADGQVVLQSAIDSLFAMSAGPAVLASSAVTNVLGASGVVIASGAAVPVMPFPVEGESPEAPSATEGHADAMQAEVDAWGEVHDALDSAASDRDALQSEMAPNQASELASAKAGVDLRQLATDTFQGPNALGEVVEGSAGALALSGAGGVMISTPLSAQVHAGAWLGLDAATVAVRASEAVDLTATGLLSATSHGAARLFAADRMDAVAKDGELHLASRTLAAELYAPAIRIGETAPEAPQEATASIALKSTGHVGLSTGDESPDVEAAGVHVITHDVIDASSKKTITLEAVDTLVFKIADLGVEIVIDKGKTVTLSTPRTTLEVSESGVSVTHGAEVLKASDSECFVGPSSASRFTASPSAVSIKGSKISIG